MKKLLVIFFFFSVALLSSAQTKEELEARKQSTLDQIKAAQELLEKTTSEKKFSLNRLSILERGIKSRTQLISSLIEEISLLDDDIADLEAQISVISSDIKKGKDEYAKIIYSIYRSHTEEDKMMYLLASESLNQFYQRMKYMKYLKDYRERKIDELETLIAQLNQRNAELNQIKRNKENTLKEKEEENRKLFSERQERNSLIQQLAQDERKLREELAEKNRIRKDLEEKIRKIIEEEMAKNYGDALLMKLTPEQELIGNNFLQNKGRLPWPVDRGIITARFGLIDHPVLKGVKLQNNGLDFRSSPGTKARAIFDGEVKSISAIKGANYVVIVSHGQYMSVYLNVVDLKVKVGDKVLTKEEIGTIHSSEGLAEFHLEIWRAREILDPYEWISK